MTEDERRPSLAPEPEPTVDPDVERAPGGPDAVSEESDIGAAPSEGMLTPDQPLSAQQDTEEVPGSIKEREAPTETPDADPGEAPTEQPD